MMMMNITTTTLTKAWFIFIEVNKWVHENDGENEEPG